MRLAIAVVMGGMILVGPAAVAEEAAGSGVPAPFAPLEVLIGGWKGMAIPSANRLKGWPETHRWAWKFSGGNPAGMAVSIEGGKVLKQGVLTYDAASKSYRLEGVDPSGKAIAYGGGFDTAARALTLERLSESRAAKERLILRPSANRIRYSMWLDRQEPGATRFRRVIDAGLTREGEAFASGGSADALPKCIITGGASTMAVTYQGKSYPLCCSGCRDEFNADPEKYVRKALMRAKDGPGAGTAKTSDVGEDDGSFDGLVEESLPGTADRTPPRARPQSAPAGGRAAAAPESTRPSPSRPLNPGKSPSRAASLLRLGRNLETQGKAAAARDFYNRVVKEYPGTPEAKAAALRLGQLSGVKSEEG